MLDPDTIRLRHMLDAARQAVQFVEGRTRSALNHEPMLMLSLVKLVEIIGEAASQTTKQGQSSVPDLPWADIIAMRHRLVHAYFDINLDILWQTVTGDLPLLIRLLEKALDERAP